jgi:hypothetical protein
MYYLFFQFNLLAILNLLDSNPNKSHLVLFLYDFSQHFSIYTLVSFLSLVQILIQLHMVDQRMDSIVLFLFMLL